VFIASWLLIEECSQRCIKFCLRTAFSVISIEEMFIINRVAVTVSNDF
jgi:hypothetical protein